MDRARNISTAAFSLVIVACGPPALGSGATADETSSSDDNSELTDSGMTSTEPSDTESTTDPTTDPHPFLPPDDFLPSCDPWLQDCPEGEKCVPYSSSGGQSWDANKCVPILGDQAPGEPCTYSGVVEATDDCDASGACINAIETEGELIGTCWPFCTGTPDVPGCPEGSSCKLSGSGTLTFCVPLCNPLVQDCPPGLACYWVGFEFNCVFTTQDIPAGEPCGFINDCAPGLICIDVASLPNCAGAACCTEFCSLSLGGPQCDLVPGTSCVSLFEEGAELPGYEDVGVCVLP
jgi:hypothetical protein